MKRFLSRKFIVALAAQLSGLAVLIWPQHSEGIAAMAESLSGLLIVVLSSLGYIAAEASIDRKAASAPQDDAS